MKAIGRWLDKRELRFVAVGMLVTLAFYDIAQADWFGLVLSVTGLLFVWWSLTAPESEP